MVLRSRPEEAANVYWEHAWALAAERYPSPAAGGPAGETELRAELLFCLLGGHAISYEHNLSAADRLWNLGVLRGERPEPTRAAIERELRRPQFDPPRRDGTARRYRFPARKATLLAGAQFWLHELSSLGGVLAEIPDEAARREFLCQCPGVGAKSASWLLRNTGYAERLAVLDIHVVRAMQACGRLGSAELPRDYEDAEAAYLRWCAEFNFDPARFDLLVWDFSRWRG